MDIEQYEKVKILGEGTYGKCYLVRHKQTLDIFVLKQVEIYGMQEDQLKQAVKEASILQALDHPFIVNFKGSNIRDGHLNILMTYADGGDLSMRIKQVKEKGQVFEQNTILNWFTQICLAVKHVHDRKIIHRDIKAQNIFLTSDNNVKLGDFGISRPLQLTLQKIKSVVGTPYYMSPQIYDNKEYSFKADIWSLGVILLEMCLLKPPFDALSLPALAVKILKGQHYPIPKNYSKELRKLVNQMLQVNPNKRPSIHNILNNPLVKGRIDEHLTKIDKQREFSHTVLHSKNFFEKHFSQKQLMIDIGEDPTNDSIHNAFSPKNFNSIVVSSPELPYQKSKHGDMPVKRIDNYLKQMKNDKKTNKKNSHELRRRQVSEPNLTPKAHTKIENERKILNKNNSLVNFQKKKSNKEITKRKSKGSTNPYKQMQEINLIKDQIVGLHQQFSNRSKVYHLPDISKSVIPEEMREEASIEYEIQEEQQIKIDDDQTIERTIEEMMLQTMNQSEVEVSYSQCCEQGGFSTNVKKAGLMSLLYGYKNQLI